MHFNTPSPFLQRPDTNSHTSQIYYYRVFIFTLPYLMLCQDEAHWSAILIGLKLFNSMFRTNKKIQGELRFFGYYTFAPGHLIVNMKITKALHLWAWTSYEKHTFNLTYVNYPRNTERYDNNLESDFRYIWLSMPLNSLPL